MKKRIAVVCFFETKGKWKAVIDLNDELMLYNGDNGYMQRVVILIMNIINMSLIW